MLKTSTATISAPIVPCSQPVTVDDRVRSVLSYVESLCPRSTPPSAGFCSISMSRSNMGFTGFAAKYGYNIFGKNPDDVLRFRKVSSFAWRDPSRSKTNGKTSNFAE